MKNQFKYLITGLFAPLLSIAQTTNVGIGTTSPLARLHVVDSSVLFTGPATLPVTPTDVPVRGAGSRMMWYPQKAAWRAGQVTGDMWDSQNIGNISVAMGRNTIAKGFASTSIGTGNAAEGDNSLSTGSMTMASGYAAVSMGDQSQAGGYGSLSTGFATQATGRFATSMGENTIAGSLGSLAIGRFNESTGGSVDTWIGTDPLFLIGNGSSDLSRKNALTVLKNGNVGIGISSPILNSEGIGLHLKNNSYTQLKLESSVNNAGIEFKSRDGSLLEIGADNNSKFFVYDRSRMRFRMIVNDSGFLGIGTAAPTARLTLEGNDATPNGLSAAIKLQNLSSTNAWFLRAGGGSGTTTPFNGFSIADNSSYHFNISSEGNVGIGLLPSSAKLHVNGNMRIEGTGIFELGAGVPGKEINAGKIGYNAFGQSALTVVGAGTSALNRAVYVYAEGGTTLNGPLGFNGALRINGNAGTAGQVLTSNGTGAPVWQTPTSAYQNNIRFSYVCSDPNNTTGNLLFTERYNTNTTAVSVSGSSLTFNVTGLYHFDLAITGRVDYASPLGYEPSFSLNFYVNGGTGPGNNPVAGVRLLKHPTLSRYTTTAYAGIDMYLTAGQVLNIQFGYGNAPAGFTEIDSFGYLRGYLISP